MSIVSPELCDNVAYVIFMEETFVRDGMISEKWVFRRDTNSRYGLISSNSPSTDSVNALEAWRTKLALREILILKDSKDCLVVMLSTIENDRNSGADLDRECRVFGVIRELC